MQYLALLLVPYVMYRLGLAKTLLVFGMSLFSIVLMSLAFATGGLLTFLFDPESVRRWTLPKAWVNQLLDSTDHLWVIFFVPVIAVADLVRWMLYITILHGGVILWGCMLTGAWFTVDGWVTAIQAFRTSRAAR